MWKSALIETQNITMFSQKHNKNTINKKARDKWERKGATNEIGCTPEYIQKYKGFISNSNYTHLKTIKNIVHSCGQ